MAAVLADGGVRYFGIRHHGPGSAQRLLEALEAMRPSAVLVEGPANASPLLPLLADPAMRPPVALLCYPEDEPTATAFWPFAEFSPEYQAIVWAIHHDVPVRFIDLPAAARFKKADGEVQGDPDNPAPPPEQADDTRLVRDPIGTLAHAAGYEDGESWWTDVIEENPDPGPVFAAIADAMTALREDDAAVTTRDARREAYMRLEIAAATREFEGPLAVVCGAWHVPALQARHSRKDDRALLKGLQKRKIATTWAPWASPRLALGHGYGAGVVAPGWCRHLWLTREAANGPTVWLARIAAVLRDKGHMVSTASLIEAERLGVSLAALRDRPNPGFEELRDAAIACLFFGEHSLWQVIEDELLIGAEVGEVPSDTPLAPLLDDLQRCQKAVRLKPEALERDLALDLRSDSGLARSRLLHRLTVLDVQWGRLTDPGKSRGTFRERWVLAWEPEFAVRLVEHVTYGPTIERAANAKLIETIAAAGSLGDLTPLVHSAIVADLAAATAAGLDALERRAAHASDCLEVISALPSLAETIRYGEARETQIGALPELMSRLIAEAAIGLRFSARNLDTDAARTFSERLRAGDGALLLVEVDEELFETWRNGLRELLADRQAAPIVAGCAAQLLYQGETLTAADVALLLERRLSPGTPVDAAAGFFEGFFQGASQRLIYDDILRDAVDGWLTGLDEEDFIANLPLLRRVFSDLDPIERRRLIDSILGKRTQQLAGMVVLPDAAATWQRHLARITPLLTGNGRPS